MTEFNGSRFADLLPENLSSIVEVQAFSYAVGSQIEKLCAYANNASTYAAIEALPGKVLDILAVELRTPAYDESYSMKVKRALIKGTMTFYMQMGTPAAVNKIIETVFESGYIQEWFEYGGSPHHFKACTQNPAITSADVEEFQSVLSTVKRLSSWLDEIVLDLSTEAANIYVGHWVHIGDYITLKRATM